MFCYRSHCLCHNTTMKGELNNKIYSILFFILGIVFIISVGLMDPFPIRMAKQISADFCSSNGYKYYYILGRDIEVTKEKCKKWYNNALERCECFYLDTFRVSCYNSSNDYMKIELTICLFFNGSYDYYIRVLNISYNG